MATTETQVRLAEDRARDCINKYHEGHPVRILAVKKYWAIRDKFVASISCGAKK